MPEAVLLTTAGLHVPVIPLVDVFTKVGTLPPEQIVSEVPKENVGVIFGDTVTVNVNGFAHCPAAGVNVYVPEAVLLTVAGDQVPVMPLVDVPGSAGTDPPEQTVRDDPNAKDGVRIGLTVTLYVAVTAH